MTDSPTLRDAVERDFDMNLDDFEDFSEEDVQDILEDYAQRRWGDVGIARTEAIFSTSDFINNFRDSSPRFRNIVNEWQNRTREELIQIRKDIRERISTATDEEIRGRALSDLRKVNPQSYGQYLTMEKMRGKRAFRQAFSRLENI